MVTIRSYLASDADALIAIQRQCFPPPYPESLHWTREQIASHVRHFPDGALCAVGDGQLVGSCTANRITFDPAHPRHTWAEAAADGWLSNCDPAGDTLYGVDIAVVPAWRGRGVARLFYETRYALVRRLGLKRFLAASRLAGLHRHPALEPETYAEQVIAEKLVDPVITPQLRAGLRPLTVVRDYLSDLESRNCALLMEWRNPELP
jgi:GNAT superfamily N-acetyltransferase